MCAHTKIGAVLGVMVLVAACATAPTPFNGGVLTDSKGMTLYTFDKDKKPGDRTGDGFRNVWHVVKEPGGSMGGY
jgi:predicted lipoprotein with Yx(FWY)xxD motif